MGDGVKVGVTLSEAEALARGRTAERDLLIVESQTPDKVDLSPEAAYTKATTMAKRKTTNDPQRLQTCLGTLGPDAPL